MGMGWLPLKLSITLLVQSLPVAGTGLDPVLVVSSDSTLGSDRYRVYASAAEVAAALTATEISATAAAQATAAFGGLIRPSRVVIGRRDGGTSEAWGTALAAIRAAGAEFSYVVADTRTIADLVAIGTWADAEGDVMYVAQSSDASWLNSGVPSGFTAKASMIVIYHPTDTQYADASAAGTWSAINPNVKAPAGRVRVVGPTTYSLGTSEITAADANFCNVLRPLQPNRESAGVGMWTGWTSTGDVYSMLISRIWLVNQIKRRVGNIVAAYWDTASRLAGPEGANQIAGVFSDLGELGVAVKHWRPSATLPDGFAVTVGLDDTGTTVEIVARYHLNDEIREISSTIYLERGV